MKIFWSWQSDTPGKIGRHFVRNALRDAIAKLKQPEDVEEPLQRGVRDLHLDHDREGVPGSPDLASTIFGKIERAVVFVADVTLVGQSLSSRGGNIGPSCKKFINSNVAIEYGYALRILTDAAILMVQNCHYGEREELPFDIKHKAGPIQFRLAPNASRTVIAAERARLTHSLVVALRPYLSRAGNASPDAYPHVIATFRGQNDPGPYGLVIFNDSKEPFINMSISIGEAGIIAETQDIHRLGDIEIGATPLPQIPRLPLGYYQITIRYRGVNIITEMLQIASVNGEPRQYTWLSTDRGLVRKPDDPTPRLPIFSFQVPEYSADLTKGALESPIRVNNVRFIMPWSKFGLYFRYFSISSANIVYDKATVRLLYLNIEFDGVQIARIGSSVRIVQKGYSAVFEGRVPSASIVASPSTKVITLEFEIDSDTTPEMNVRRSYRKLAYHITWPSGTGGDPSISQELLAEREE